MTEKQLEGIVKFMLMFENTDIPIKAINNAYGLNLSETTSREEALKKYLEASNIVLDDQDVSENITKATLYLIADHVLTLNSKNDWIRKVPIHLPEKTRKGEKFLFVDFNGCVLEIGADFISAENINSYPVKVYKLKAVHEYENEITHIRLGNLNIGDHFKYNLGDVGVFKVISKIDPHWIDVIRVQSLRRTGSFPSTMVYKVKTGVTNG